MQQDVDKTRMRMFEIINFVNMVSYSLPGLSELFPLNSMSRPIESHLDIIYRSTDP